MTSMPDLNLDPTVVMIGFITTALIAFGILYVYFSIILMVLASKTDTANGWMAWIPIANLVLMCEIGRRSPAWILAMFVPFLNIIAMLMIWISIAAARGKPGWTGALVFLPVIGLLVPIYLCIGPARKRAIDAPSGTCPNCRNRVDPDDTYCGECGAAVPQVDPTKLVKPISAGGAFGVSLLMIIVLVGLSGVGTYFVMTAPLEYSPPADRQAPAMPQRMSGMMTEFPIDNAETPARPTSVIAQTYERGKTDNVQVPSDQLPPGVRPDTLPAWANSSTSVVYKSPQHSKPVNVHVMDTRYRNVAAEITDAVVRSTRGTQSGVRVQSPTGHIYTGTKVQTTQITVYIMFNPTTSTCILIYAPDPSVHPVAARLAQNVGNGKGLADDPIIKNSLWVLPANLPNGLRMSQTRIADMDELGLDADDFNTDDLGDDVDQDVKTVINQVKQFMPQRIIAAEYIDPGQQKYYAGAFDFGSARPAWNLWWIIKFLSAGQMQRVSLNHGGGLFINAPDGQFVVFQRGPYIVLLGTEQPAPSPNTANDVLVALANAFQM